MVECEYILPPGLWPYQELCHVQVLDKFFHHIPTLNLLLNSILFLCNVLAITQVCWIKVFLLIKKFEIPFQLLRRFFSFQKYNPKQNPKP